MDNTSFKKLVDYMHNYTKDFIVVDRDKTFHGGMLDEFTVTLAPNEIIASYAYPDGSTKVFWGGDVRFVLHGQDCVLLTECENGSDDLIVMYNTQGYAYGARVVHYGDQYVHI